MADTLAELREAVELAQKALDNELFNNDKPMTAPPFAGMLANVADQQAQLIDAQQRRIEALEKGLRDIAEMKRYTFADTPTGEVIQVLQDMVKDMKGIAYDLLRAEKGGEG